ncbi:MAG: accessory gene regulator B family protein [Acutalibacter muris]|jgi:accessory gene regulator B|nr:accessory gene regulator B family protein [Acutalibacter muris]
MLNRCANYLTDMMYKFCPLAHSSRPVYVYGFELLLSTGCSIASIIVLSAVFSLVHYALLFLGVFISLRLFNGGFHAKTYGKCFLVTNAVYLIVLSTSLFVQNIAQISIYRIGYLLITVSAATVIYVLSPIKHVNHPLSERQYRHNQKIGRRLVVVIVVANCILFFYPLPIINPVLISFTIVAVAMMMIIPQFTERRK